VYISLQGGSTNGATLIF